MSERRFRRSRGRERGATLFVVVLAITLLTGVGLYTVHSSSLSARAASSGREALQAERVTELYATGALTKLRLETESTLIQYFLPNPTLTDLCEMNQGLPGTPHCRKIPLMDMLPPSGAPMLATDSLGALGTLGGGARIELTDVYKSTVPVPGGPAQNYYTGNLTVIGRIDPAGMAGACVQDQMQVSAQHMMRLQLTLGPVQL